MKSLAGKRRRNRRILAATFENPPFGNLRLVVTGRMLSPSPARMTSHPWESTLMDINRRTLLASGTALAGLSVLRGETNAQAAGNSEVPPGAVILTAIVKAKPGQEDAVKDALLSLVEPTRKEAGCLCYNLHQSKADATQFMFYEQWASKYHLDAHGKTPHMKALGGKLKDKTDPGGVVFYELLK
jgi:quinol monooxygenase YgiN